MYAALGIIENSNHSGELMGVHQKLDRTARWLIAKNMPIASIDFPNITSILHFEGSRGPDGLKRKSPGKDDPDHFIEPNNDDGKLITLIQNHHYNLVQALIKHDKVRASFEAAWMAHAITDGLTPAHHYPFREERDELVGDADYVKVFGVKLKGVSKGDTFAETMRKNWLYLGAGGLMTKHIAFEYGVAYIITPARLVSLQPKDFKRSDAENADFEKAFYAGLERVVALDMYQRFLDKGWTTDLAIDTREVLIPEIVRAITLGWASAVSQAKLELKNEKK